MPAKLIRTLCVWIAQRLVEVVLGAWILLLVFGPTGIPGWDGVIGNIHRNAYLVSYFMIASGYVLTTGWLVNTRHKRGSYEQGGWAVFLYVVHALLFAHSWQITQLLPVLIFGCCSVIVAQVVGNAIDLVSRDNRKGAISSRDDE